MKKIFFLASVVCAGLFAMVSCGDKDEELNDDRGGSGSSEGIVVGHGDHMIAGIIANETVLSFCDPYFLFEHDGKVDSFACNAPEVESEEFEINGENFTAYVVEKEIKSRPVTIRVKTSEKPDFDQKIAEYSEASFACKHITLQKNTKEWNEAALEQMLKYDRNVEVYTFPSTAVDKFRSYLTRAVGGYKTIE